MCPFTIRTHLFLYKICIFQIMASFKLSQLEELTNITEEQSNVSYIMIVANDELGRPRNYRIRLSELHKFVQDNGLEEKILTPEEIAVMINAAIKKHETIYTGGSVVTIPEKVIEVDTTLKSVTTVLHDIKNTTTDVVKETETLKETIEEIETATAEEIVKTKQNVEEVKSTVLTVVEEKLPQVEEKIQTVVVEKLPQVEENIVNITQEIEILKVSQPNMDSVTEEHVDEIFNECFK